MAGAKPGGWAWSALLLASIAVAQAPVVPTDHYGPPACSAALNPGTPLTAAKAHEEQRLGVSDPRALPSSEPLENFGILRARLQTYADCTGSDGCYWADLDTQYRRAEEALRGQIAARHGGDKLALVLDIDETTLSSYCEMRREDFGYIDSMFNTWVITPDAAVAIPGALRLVREAQAAGISVFFITGRPGASENEDSHSRDDQTAATARNLEAAGFHRWTGLALRVGPEKTMSTIEYKSRERRRILDHGYRIVMSVGDQWSDLLGDPKAEVSIKLPNPFYFLP